MVQLKVKLVVVFGSYDLSGSILESHLVFLFLVFVVLAED